MFPRTFLICYVVLVGRDNAAPTTTQTRLVDLAGSGTGYTYNHQQGVPVYYVQYTNHGSGPRYYTPDTVHYVLGAAAPVASAIPETTPQPYAIVAGVSPSIERTRQQTANYGKVQRSRPRAPYYDVAKVTRGADEREEKTRDEEDVGRNHEDLDDEDTEGYSGHGQKYEDEEHEKRGEKGHHGYKKSEKHSKGEEGLKDEGVEQRYHDVKGGHKKGEVDEVEEEDSHEETEKNVKSNDYGHSSYHKKGNKTSGYHNVYHKDEYKKETDYYDEDHKEGHFDKHEEFNEGFKKVEGDFKEDERHSSERDREDRGQKGWFHKGHRDNQDQGHRVEKGEKSYFDNREHHDVEEGSKFNKTHKSHKDSAKN